MPQPATPSMDQIRATRARQMQYEGGQQYHRSPQQQMAHSETAHVTAMQTQMATLVGHMVSRVGDLEGQVNLCTQADNLAENYGCFGHLSLRCCIRTPVTS